jgi:hypothetical protein
MDPKQFLRTALLGVLPLAVKPVGISIKITRRHLQS